MAQGRAKSITSPRHYRRLKHRVVIEHPVATQNEKGEVIHTWQPFATRWAAIEPLRGSELFESKKDNAELITRIRLRYLSGVTTKMRCVSDRRIFEIQSIINVNECNKELRLLTQELL